MVTFLGCANNLNHKYAKPKAYLEKTTFNIAAITDETLGIQEFDIPVFNAGNRALKLDFEESTCGCIQLIGYDFMVSPGNVGAIRVAIDPALGSFGDNNQWLRFKTNDPILPSLRIKFYYDIAARSFAFSPHVIELETTKIKLLEQKGMKAGTIWIRDMSNEKLNIERIEFTKPYFGYTLYDLVYTCRSGIKSHRLRINVFINSEVPAGRVEEKMKLYTNNPDFTLIEIPINGFIKPRIDVSPESIILRNLLPDQEVKRKIVLRARDTIMLENVQLKHPWLKVLDLLEEGKEVFIIIGGRVPRKTLSIYNSRMMIDRARLEIGIKEPDPYATSIEIFAFYANID
jgi:hypothetical protein